MHIRKKLKQAFLLFRYVKTANSVVLDYSVKVRYRIFEYERPVCLVVGIELNHGGCSTGLGNLTGLIHK